MKKDSIILDLDGTLWDATEIISMAWNRAIRQAKTEDIVISKEMLKEQFGKTMKIIENNLFSEIPEENRHNLMEECYRQEHEALFATTDCLLYPGVSETLKELSKKFRLFIVSNCHTGYIELFLKKYNLRKYITDIECFGNNGNNKGTNIKLITSRNQLKAPVYVGDTRGDQEAAAYAGVPFIFTAYGYGNVTKYTARIDEFSQLASIIQQ